MGLCFTTTDIIELGGCVDGDGDGTITALASVVISMGTKSSAIPPLSLSSSVWSPQPSHLSENCRTQSIVTINSQHTTNPQIIHIL